MAIVLFTQGRFTLRSSGRIGKAGRQTAAISSSCASRRAGSLVLALLTLGRSNDFMSLGNA